MADKASFVFFNSFLCVLDVLPNDQQLELYQAISHYGAFQEVPKTTDPLVLGIFGTIKPLLDKSAQRYEAAKKGGAPQGNQNARKQKQLSVDLENNLKQLSVDLENNLKQPSVDFEKQPYVYVDADVDADVYADDNVDVDNNANVDTRPPYNPPKGEVQTLQEKRFNEFWAEYPKKQGKGAAQKSWDKIHPDTVLHAQILEAVKSNAEKNPQWRKDNGQYIPNPATWLNQRRWEDDRPWETQRTTQGTARADPADINRSKRAQFEWLMNSIAEDEENAKAGG